MMRYAAYIRTSTHAQTGNFAIDAQRQASETWVATQGGQMVEVYIDEARSGRVANRPALQQMLQGARRGEFDALVVHRFDRLARTQVDVQAIQRRLQAHNITVFAASGKEAYA